MRPMRTSSRRSLLLFPVLFIGAACDVDYVSHLACGQLEVLARLRPLDEAINDPSLSEVERARLAVVRDVRRFGIESIGLKETDAYTHFDPNGSVPAAYVLTAAEKDRLVAYSWSFPFIGEVQYKGFFDRGRAEREAASLRDQGYDVLFGTADGFSTLGLFPDPVRQSNLSRDEIDLAELILHEMTHTTIYKPSDTDFNEAMATFVGRSAALRFFETTRGDDDDITLQAANRFEDAAVVDAFVVQLYDDAHAYYADSAAAGDDRATIIAGRQSVFDASLARYEAEFETRLHEPQRWASLKDLELDNAVVLAGVRYQAGLEDFAAVLDAAGGDFPAALQVYAEAAGQADSRTYLRDWVADR
ncbi:MAG TPA: aminopeptidase [Phycisphaerae bacterium]|nr:aminopeptidase [Phycisphaerae bacterium]